MDRTLRELRGELAENDPTSAVVCDAYSDDYVRDILRGVKTIAVVGASDEVNRPSYFVIETRSRRATRSTR